MPGSAPLKITTRSGNVRVRAEPGAELEVVDGSIETRDDGTLHIRRLPSSSVIEVRCASGTEITVGTVSGKVELLGAFGTARVATVSGRIRIEEVARLDLRTKSGTIDIGTCSDACRIMTKSSAVHVGRAGRATVAAVSGVVHLEHVDGAEVKTVSGKVVVGAGGKDRVSVHTVSGKVEIQVPPATKPLARLRSVSGHVQCDCPPGHDVEIAVVSVSGAVRVSSG